MGERVVLLFRIDIQFELNINKALDIMFWSIIRNLYLSQKSYFNGSRLPTIFFFVYPYEMNTEQMYTRVKADSHKAASPITSIYQDLRRGC